MRVLEICAEQMVSKWEFGNVPIDVIPPDLQEALYSLLDEELIIRRDASTPESEAMPDEAINFTFDEFRDFMLSQYLVHKLFPRSQTDFIGIISKTMRNETAHRGLEAIPFLRSSKEKEHRIRYVLSLPTVVFNVYDREVFNLDVRSLVVEDGDAIRKRLGLGPDYETMQIARALAYRWNRDYWPVLNLGLLLDHVEQVGRAHTTI